MRYICQICGYVYDDAKEKIPFEQLPADWKCPLCGAAKPDFAPERPKAPASAGPGAAEAHAERKPLSPGQLAALLRRDAEGYAGVRAAADAAPDRGAARVCVWGEKVTRMLSSLVDRYLREGEALLAGTEVWVCTVCGFVWVGEEAPPLCPVCKVPDWKFEKIEGRA